MRYGELKHIFNTLERRFAELGVDFYLIGALAREIWYERGDISFRVTKDVDYAVLVSSNEEYQAIRAHLITLEKFSAIKGNDFGLIAPDGTHVDILPFSEIEDDGSLAVSGQGLTNIQLDGLVEVYAAGTEMVDFESGHSFKVATLPAIALLKFIAYDDRPDQRQKDVTDIANLVTHFFVLHSEMIYENHNDLFDESLVSDFESIAPIVLGREMRKIAKSSNELVERLNAILEKHKQQGENSAFIRLMVQRSKQQASVESMIKVIINIHRGFNDFQ